jgi:CubicO group peptidase (beta-lactamase class C family)
VDTYFRGQEIQGYVHDMGAAMLGGVSGHAGLFSSANDLAKLFQMLLNGGIYGQKQYLKPETVHQFTTRYEKSTRRGFGFDMKEQNPEKELNMGTLAGPNTFGHLGFTGTCVWADPDKNLVYIFLSNRTYPSMDNGKLGAGNFRPRIQNVIYRSIAEGQ